MNPVQKSNGCFPCCRSDPKAKPVKAINAKLVKATNDAFAIQPSPGGLHTPDGFKPGVTQWRTMPIPPQKEESSK